MLSTLLNFSCAVAETPQLSKTLNAGADPPFHDLTEYPIYYAPTLAVHYANAFVPGLFVAAGKQPVRANDFVERLAIPGGTIAADIEERFR